MRRHQKFCRLIHYFYGLMNKRYKLEIAVSDFATTKLAVEGGADRIELCGNLAEGGTTQSYGVLRKSRETFSLPIFPIIRPRGGDFLYSEEEFNIMKQDILLCKDLGFDGVVIGMLQEDGKLDLSRNARLVELAYPMGVTFHRAFDRCADPFQALDQIIQMGCERLLTSGQEPTAPQGVDLIAELQKKAGQDLIIMPGSGVRAENILELANRTGCTEFHSSLRSLRNSDSEFRHPAFANDPESYQNNFIDPDEVAKLKNSLNSLA